MAAARAGDASGASGATTRSDASSTSSSTARAATAFRPTEGFLLRLVGPLCFTLATHATKRGVKAGLGAFQFTFLRSALNLLFTLAIILYTLLSAARPSTSNTSTTSASTITTAAASTASTASTTSTAASPASLEVKRPLVWPPRNPRLLILRGLFGSSAMLCYTRALALLPTANALIISRFHPFLGGVFSFLFLGERFRYDRQYRSKYVYHGMTCTT